MKRSIRRLCTLGVWILMPTVVAAQGTTGSISGTVTDPQKAVVPGVTILVQQVETGAERTLVSDEHGRYTALNLSPGPYRISATLTGFRSVVRDQLTVDDRQGPARRYRDGSWRPQGRGHCRGRDEQRVAGLDHERRRRHDPADRGAAPQRPQLHAAGNAAAGRDHQPRHGEGLHRRIRIHAAGDRRRTPRADRLPDGRHEHR